MHNWRARKCDTHTLGNASTFQGEWSMGTITKAEKHDNRVGTRKLEWPAGASVRPSRNLKRDLERYRTESDRGLDGDGQVLGLELLQIQLGAFLMGHNDQRHTLLLRQLGDVIRRGLIQ